MFTFFVNPSSSKTQQYDMVGLHLDLISFLPASKLIE